MAPLVGYDSSDDDEEVQQTETPAEEVAAIQEEQMVEPGPEAAGVTQLEAKPPSPIPQPEPSTATPPIGPSIPPDSALMGPSLPPADAAEAYPEGEGMDQDQDLDVQADPSQPPLSPYTTNRSLLHNLTMPTVANLDIPPSPPPGSPSSDAAQAALTAKFDNFLELKRKKGVHFNARIADSHAFKNPAQTDKLLGFVGLDAEGTEQYGTVLPKELWDSAVFPDWAYRKELRKTQERVQKDRGRREGEAVQFVPASS
ncbi:hypothetical protein VP1G_05174 [Cytospora mali]|uniref:Meiotically up-regulated gene 151 protein n=1 Tax=Cytospora mali TaxID=578113 RepID=A0A194V1U1_CYTMA|nr:hypothetical protein VP1G_05174 [Valsa mali var. pyri (nom. inval.)]